MAVFFEPGSKCGAAAPSFGCIHPSGEDRRQREPKQRKVGGEIVAALKRCGKIGDLECGKKLHRDAIAANLHTDRYVAVALIDMYSKCRSLASAREVFDGLLHRSVFQWTALIMGYADAGLGSAAMELFAAMDCEPNSVTFIALLKACGRPPSENQEQIWLDKGIAIHKQITDRGFSSDIKVGSALVDMYSRCGSMQRARQVFDEMIFKDVVVWSSIITGYVDNRENSVALELFSAIDCQPNRAAYLAVLRACGALGNSSQERSQQEKCLNKGITIHQQLKHQGLDSDMFVACTLIDMYSKCGSMDRARQIFDRMVLKNVVAWNSIILGYVRHGEFSAAMELLTAMDCKPSSVTYMAAFKVCGGLASGENPLQKQAGLEKGIAIHKQMRDKRLESDIAVASSLVEMYSKCSSMDRAREIFDRMVSKDVVTWNSIILGYEQQGQSSTAMQLFAEMDCKPDSFTFVAVLSSCRSLAALSAGQQIHAAICRLGLQKDDHSPPIILNTLMDFYGSFGSASRSEELFSNMNSPTVASWTILMGVHGLLGNADRVFNLVKAMREAGLKPDSVTFMCILRACSHVGLPQEAARYFESMPACGVSPSIGHYTCMVDMLGRANRLHEALSLVRSMPVEANSVTWMALLGACRKWKNLEVGKVAFDALVTSGVAGSAAYELMSDILSGCRADCSLVVEHP